VALFCGVVKLRFTDVEASGTKPIKNFDFGFGPIFIRAL